MKESERIAAEIDLAYRDGFWGGGSIHGLFRSLSASEAASYPISGAHCSWEIALHLASWAKIFRGRIAGEIIDSIAEKDWPAQKAATEANWIDALDDLDKEHKSLVYSLRNIKMERLDKLVPGKKFTFREMLHGVSQHVFYHAGQVGILKRAVLTASEK